MIAEKIENYLGKASWIRKMFEEGAALRKIHGEKNVFDFTLGNPAVEPPEAFNRELRRMAEHPEPGMHRYMSNAGFEKTRRAVAEVLTERSSKKVSAQHVLMTCGAGGRPERSPQNHPQPGRRSHHSHSLFRGIPFLY